MTVLYNRSTRDYYLVTGLNKEVSNNNTSGDKTKNPAGDFIIISSGKKSVATDGVTTSGYSISLTFLKKIALILFLISLIPFSSVIATGYMHLLNERKSS